MAYNLPIAENLNPYDSTSLIRSQGTTGAWQGPVQPAAPAPVQSPTPTQTSVATPTPTVAQTMGTPEPTIGDTLAGIKTKALAVQDQLNQMNKAKSGLTGLGYETGVNPYAEAIKPLNEKEIQRNQMKLFQKEIDATNRVYNDMLNQERLAGQGRLGTQTAIAARGGLLGSDFGEAQRQTQVTANQGAERAVENERLAKIGTIMGTMRKAVADEIANKRLARQQDAESWVKYLAAGKERNAANTQIAAHALLDSGIDPATMSKEELDAISKEAKLSVNEILAGYKALKSSTEAAAAEQDLKTRKTEAEIKKIDADIAKGKLIELGEGTMLYNTETGETFKNPKTYAPSTGSGSSSIDITGEDKRTLLGGGWTSSDLDNLASDVASQGLEAVIKNAKEVDKATDAQIAALRKVYSSTEPTTSKIDRDFISTWYGIPDNNEGSSSFLGFEWGETNSEQIDNLMATVERYKAVGMTDEEIYKKLEE